MSAPYGVTRRIPVSDTGLVLIVGNHGAMFRIENASGAIEFPSDDAEQLAIALRRTAVAAGHGTKVRPRKPPPPLVYVRSHRDGGAR
jgi:hypothetical protein